MCITDDSESILGEDPGDKAALDRRGGRYRAEDPGNFLTAQGDTPLVRHGGPRHPDPPPVYSHQAKMLETGIGCMQ